MFIFVKILNNMNIRLILTASIITVLSWTAAAEGVSPRIIIPQVKSYTLAEDSFILEKGASFSIEAPRTGGQASASFQTYLESCDLALTPASKGTVRFRIGGKGPKGSYSMVIGPDGIRVSAPDFSGAFYAVQSLIQMAEASPQRELACARIDDAPRFAYRGLMFDMVRHFHSKEFILKQLDAMALLKMNRFHFHLTDNEAWRIQLDSAPEMLEDAYYTKEDIREIIAYADARHIEVIPEIELPGHNRALLRIHPEFFCDGGHWVKDVICPGKEAPFEFFTNVLNEVMDLFPSKYIHIGGDEASKANWHMCDRCAERMTAEGLEDIFELQSYCIKRVEKVVTAHRKRLIGWDEILEGGLSENATVMSWRGTEGGVNSLQMGHDVIMTPNTYYYLDYGQDAPYKEPLAQRTYLPLDVVYNYEPETDIEQACGGELTPQMRARLLGVQGNLWSEWVVTDSHFEYMLYPRAFAIAETGWSPKGSKDLATFRSNALTLIDLFKRKGYTTFDLAGEVGERPEAQGDIPRITGMAKATLREGDGWVTDVPVLVDGRLGGWATKGGDTWLRIPAEEVTIEVDLGSVKELHYIGAEFTDYSISGNRAPQDTEFSISEDGVNYTPVPLPQLRFDENRKTFSIVTAGGTVSARARFIRLHFNHGQDKVRTYLSEVLVN